MDIISVDMTGTWEEKLSFVEQGTLDAEQFEKEMIDFVLKQTDLILKTPMRTVYGTNIPSVGKCPICGRDVKEGKNSYFCSGYSKENSACSFVISKIILGAKIPTTEIKKMLSGKPSKEFTFKKADGNSWKSPLTLSDTGELVFGLNKNKGEKNMSEIKAICPECGGKIIEREKGFFCENSGQNGSCNVALWKESNGATYTADDVEILLTGGTVRKMNTWKSGKTSENDMKFENGKVVAIFEERTSSRNVLKCKCPKCGGDIVETPKAFSCANDGCDVAIWKNSFTNATYTSDDAEILLTGGTVKKTNTWKSGKTSDNDMKYNKETNRVEAIFNS